MALFVVQTPYFVTVIGVNDSLICLSCPALSEYLWVIHLASTVNRYEVFLEDMLKDKHLSA